MAKGNYLVRGDKTTCGGVITEGCDDHLILGKAAAREGDKVTCGQHPGMFSIVGGIANDVVHGRKQAGTLDSKSSCPCQARFLASMTEDTYESASSSDQACEEHSDSDKDNTAESPGIKDTPTEDIVVSSSVQSQADSSDPDEQQSGWLAYYGTDMQPLKRLAYRSFVDSDVPKIIIAGDGHRNPPFAYAESMPGVLSAFQGGALRLYVEYTRSGWMARNKTPGALPSCLTQKKRFFQKDIVTPWENETMAESSKEIFEMLTEKMGDTRPLTPAEKKRLGILGQQFADGLKTITPDLAKSVREHINNIVTEPQLPDADVMALVTIISGKWRDMFVNEDLACRMAKEIIASPKLTRLISIGDAHLDDNNNPFHILLAQKLADSMSAPPVILVNKSSSY